MAMATSFSSIRTPIGPPAAAQNHHRNRNRNIQAAAQSNSWWSPLFGWSSEPDYINSGVKIEAGQVVSENDPGRISAETNLFRGCFTEDKAKELRKKTIESSNFHDIMYHSAIASRLASDLSGLWDRWLWLCDEVVGVIS